MTFRPSVLVALFVWCWCCDRPRIRTTLLISLSVVSCVSVVCVWGGTSLHTRFVCFVIADTVVFTHALPSTTLEMEMGMRQELLEKPTSKADHLRMLQDLNGNVCEVVTGLSLGEWFFFKTSVRVTQAGSNGVFILFYFIF